MSELHSDSVANLSHSETDDLKMIHGIGPAVERRLNSGGIHTYSQLAAQSPDHLARLLTGMTGFTVQRIIEKDWIGQATRLGAEMNYHDARDGEPDSVESRQHYAVFTVEFLMDQNNRVRRSRAMSVQDQKESAWAGWDSQRLLEFFADSANMNLPQNPDKKIELPEWGSPMDAQMANGQIDFLPAHSQSPDPQVRNIKMELSGSEGHTRLIHRDQPYKISLMVDLSNADAVRETPYEYSATVFAKKLGGGAHHQIIGKAEGKLAFCEHAILEIEGLPLAMGVYRLETLVTLLPFGKPLDLKSRLMAMEEGEIIQVY